MQDANDLPWTDEQASAEHVALGPVGHGVWTAPTSPQVAMSAALGSDDIAVAAYANHGRWIVECPDCHGAQMGCPDDQRFMCNSCANVAVGGLWRPVTWPDARATIAEVLDVRPVVNRNWTDEAIAELEAENVEVGLT